MQIKVKNMPIFSLGAIETATDILVEANRLTRFSRAVTEQNLRDGADKAKAGLKGSDKAEN